VVATFMALLFFYALTKLPLAETIAISFVAPLVALWLAAWLLSERIQRKAVGAAVLGMAGTLVIVGGRIGRERMDEGVWLGLSAIMASALLYAWNLILQRQQAQRAKPAEVAVFHSGVATVILACGLPFLWQTPATEVLWQAGASALLTVAGSLLFAWAYARAEAQALVPIEYSGFLWAALFGWLFFAEGVTGTTVLGTGLIVIGCWLAARRRPLPDEV
jgi:S-adenosylmethionine uptake transporter